MKYFDKEWSSGNLVEDLFDKRCEDYWTYIDSIYWKLPFGFKLLAKSINLHDAVVNKVYLNKKDKIVQLDCQCGDLQVGYFSLMIRYLDVINSIDMKNFMPSKEYKHIEIDSSEIELLNCGYISHKMGFITHKEVEIISKEVVLKITAGDPKIRNIHCEIITV